MAKKLTPRILDIKITEITAKAVTYDLTGNGNSEEWEQPNISSFNTSTLQVGVRYVVQTKVIMAMGWDPDKKKRCLIERFDWVTATPVAPKIKLQARTKKQREAAEALAAMPVVDDGSLFSF